LRIFYALELQGRKAEKHGQVNKRQNEVLVAMFSTWKNIITPPTMKEIGEF